MVVNVNIDNAIETDFNSIGDKLDKIKGVELPVFVTDKPDVEKIKADCADFKGYKNIIQIGNGGSINPAESYYVSLGSDKNFVFLTTMEPDYINELKKKYKKEETLILVISKSGTTVGVLESMFAFLNDDYKVLALTNMEKGTLLDITKIRNFSVIEHPPVGGRYSGRTSCALVPAEIMGLNVADIETGCVSMYERCAPSVPVEDNPALKLASVLYMLEEKGYVDVFMPIYSMELCGFNQLIVQLMHESFGKNGKGQTYFGALAPESQHHTNQRFFGGPKNCCGLFIRSQHQKDEESKISVPEDLKDVPLRAGTVSDLAGVPYARALDFEFEGTYQDAVNNKIPSCVVTLDIVNEKNIGEFMAFWQYVACYASMLRDVNPYDQPQVESSKEISFEMRMNYEK